MGTGHTWISTKRNLTNRATKVSIYTVSKINIYVNKVIKKKEKTLWKKSNAKVQFSSSSQKASEAFLAQQTN